MSYILDWFNLLSGFSGAKSIVVPTKYRQSVIAAKSIFDNDVTGLSTTLSDFMIKNAVVDYKVETPNENLNDVLNSWITDLNSEYSTYIPGGIKALAKQYFTERWKGSSHILLRCAWDKIDGFELPSQMVFVAGEDIIVERGDDKVKTIDNIKYYLRLSSKKDDRKKLPFSKEETIYVRKPFESWDVDEPVPFVIKRGIYYNYKFMEMILDKTSFIISKAMKYILQILQGSEGLELADKNVYDENDLTATKNQLKELEARSNTEAGVPAYATNWDTNLKHVIPDYESVLKQTLFTAVTQRLLNGYGVLEIEKSSRREDALNPKPMISEIENGIQDFTSLLEDVLRDVRKRNEKKHPKYFRNTEIKVWAPPLLKTFITQEFLTHIRSAYDRGDISKETYSTVIGFDWKVEVNRRMRELTSNIEDLMQPHAIQVQDTETEVDKDVTDDKTGPEKKNFEQNKKAQQEAIKKLKEYYEAPYKTTKDLPDSVKVLPSEGQKLWLKVFNETYKSSDGDEVKARKVAWEVVKENYEKDKKGNWVEKKS